MITDHSRDVCSQRSSGDYAAAAAAVACAADSVSNVAVMVDWFSLTIPVFFERQCQSLNQSINHGLKGVRNEQRSTGRPLELEATCQVPPAVAILMLLNFYRFVLTSWTQMQIASCSCALGKSGSSARLVATGHEM